MTTRILGIYGLIFIIFGLLALVFFQGTFLAPAAYVELLIGLVAVVVYLLKYFGDTTRRLWKKRDLVFGGLGALLILLILVGVNVVAHSKFGEKKFDLTTDKLHSLSEESVATIKRLPSKIEVISFVSEPKAKKLLDGLIKKYTYETDKISFRSIDPDLEPTKLQELEAQLNQVVLLHPETQKKVLLDEAQFNEQEFTNALRRVLVEETKAVYFLQGHGEGALDDDKTTEGMFLAKFLLEREGYSVKALELAKTPEIPVDAEVIVGWGAKTPISETETQLLKAFLNDGGKLIIGQDPILSQTKERVLENGYESILRDFGLSFGQSIIVQNVNFQSQRVRSATVIGLNYTEHPIVAELSGNLTQFPFAQPINSLNENATNIQQKALVLSAEAVASVTNLRALSAETNLKNTGPYALGRAAEKTWKSPKNSEELMKAELIVFGDSEFANNQYIQNSYNRDLFLNSFAYLLGAGENISIRPKSWSQSTLEITNDQRKAVYFASIFVIPQLIILLGLGIWAMRRSRV